MSLFKLQLHLSAVVTWISLKTTRYRGHSTSQYYHSRVVINPDIVNLFLINFVELKFMKRNHGKNL